MAVPQTLLAGRYRLVEVIATGGMGVVWRAWDERLDRPVAAKQLHPQPGVPENEARLAKNRAVREALITARLDHPHAVPVLDAVEHEGRPCLIMPFLPSTPLSAVLRERGTLPLQDVVRIGAETASALAAAHELGIVHRDVKPGNILITGDGAAHISDFGIAHAMGDVTLTGTGMVHGTPAYLAPEVARGGQAGFASDVFSLGSTLYAALEGEPPFGLDPNPIALLHKVAAARVPAPTRAGPLTPFLLDMLAPGPEARPTMEAVASFLAQLRTDVDEPPPPPPPPLIEGQEPSALASWFPPSQAQAPTAVTSSAASSPPSSTPSSAPSPAGRPARRAAHRRRSPAPLLVAAVVAALVLGITAALIRQPGQDTREPTAPAVAGATPSPTAADPSAEVGASPSPTPTTASTTAPTSAQTGAPAVATPESASTQAPEEQEVQPPPQAAPEGEDEPEPQPTQQTQPAQEPTADPEPAPAPEPTPAPAPATQPTQPQSGDRAAQLASAITGYYALMPEDTDSAWPRMTADYQANHAGGRSAYEAFWDDIADVAVSDVRGLPPDGAEATLTYYFDDGRVVVERTAYRLADEGGALKIAASSVLSSSG